ncbi:MAG: glutathione S-transferase family protein [Emcibacter sp.]|nr:glutathione S-transferase family protein [Emcibacter sp.]
MKIYGPRMAASFRRVNIYLKEKGIDLEHIDFANAQVEMATSAFKAMSPTGKIPVLELDDGSYVVESMAIIEYLEECYPTPGMIGATAEERVMTRSITSIVNDLFAPLGTFVRHNGPGPGFLESRGMPRHALLAEFFLPTVNRGFGALEIVMSNNMFLAGDRPMIPDCHLYALLEACIDKFGYVLSDELPQLIGWYARFSTRPSVSV